MVCVSSRFRLGHLFEALGEETEETPKAPDGEEAAPDNPAETEEPESPGRAFAAKQTEFFGCLFKRDRDGASKAVKELRDLADSPSRRRFADDNLSVVSLFYENDVWEVAKASKRALSREATLASLWETVGTEIEGRPYLARQVFKLGTLGAIRDDTSKKLAAALLGAAQLPTDTIGGPDLIVPASTDGKSGIWVSLKTVPVWGLVQLASWHLSDDDAERFLDDSAFKLMREGAPVERAAARKRAAVESMAASLGDHEYLMLAIAEDGTWEEMVFAPGPLLRDGFQDGTISVEESDRGEVAYSSTGAQVPLVRYEATIAARDGTGTRSSLFEERDGRLWLVLDQAGAAAFARETGVYLSRRGWRASAEELRSAALCRATARDIVFKRCD